MLPVLATFAIVVAVMVLKFPLPLEWQFFRPIARLEEIRKAGKVPYGVLIAAAALFAMYHRYVAA